MSKAESDALVEEIDQIRQRLAGTVDELVDRARPRVLAQRALGGVKAKFVDETGSAKLETIVPVAAGAAAVVVGLAVIRRLVR